MKRREYLVYKVKGKGLKLNDFRQGSPFRNEAGTVKPRYNEVNFSAPLKI